MSDRINSNLLDYNNLDGIEFAEIDFLQVDTRTISPVISLGYDDFFKEEKLDKDNFRQQIWQLLRFDETNERLIIIYRVCNSPQYYGFAYLKNRYILPIQFNSSVNIAAWITALTAKMNPQINKIITIAEKQSKFSISTMGKDDLFGEAELFLKKNAPKSYKLIEERQIKQNYLDSFQVIKSMEQKIELEETKSLWQEFITIVDSEDVVLNKGVNSELFTSFKTETNLELPPELKLIYSLNNGGKRLFFGFDLMPLDKVIKEWHNWKLIFDDWSLEELTGNNYSDSNKTIGMYTNPRWIPLIDTIGGDFIGMDLMPGKQGKLGQIITFGADTDTITCLANNLNHFLSLSIDLIKKPRLYNPLKKVF